ncbi:CDP-alcohol phosphatidyltransferase-domain-containing protein [Xylaria digitata]|nr:CDP-alcohol phosphatidyltransferase-domain-containing protein [Xylaria digitata]
MLTYRSAAAPARAILRGIHVVARNPNRRAVAHPMALKTGLAQGLPIPTLSSYAMTVRTKLSKSHDGLMCGTNGIGAWAFRAGSKFSVSSLRYLSSTTKRPAEGKERRESTQVEPSRSDGPHPQQLKGIRKVLPSLTPHENIYTIPNLLTFSRFVVAPFIGYAILHDAHTLALGLFAYAGVSDLLDGWIARRWKLQTVVGSVVDPMADKLLMTVLTVCLAMQGSLPIWLATIILGRDVGLGISAIYYRWISLPPPKTFTRYWDFSLPSAEVRPTTISKYNTFLQLGLMGATIVTPVVAVDVSSAMTALQYLVATTTVWSGLSYVFSKDAVRILSENKEQKSKDP